MFSWITKAYFQWFSGKKKLNFQKFYEISNFSGFREFVAKSNFFEKFCVLRIREAKLKLSRRRTWIWRQNCETHSVSTATTHLHNFRLHAKSNFCKISHFIKSEKFGSVSDYFHWFFVKLSATRHLENVFKFLRKLIFLIFRCACKANFRLSLHYFFPEMKDLEPKLRLTGSFSIGFRGLKARVRLTVKQVRMSMI